MTLDRRRMIGRMIAQCARCQTREAGDESFVDCFEQRRKDWISEGSMMECNDMLRLRGRRKKSRACRIGGVRRLLGVVQSEVPKRVGTLAKAMKNRLAVVVDEDFIGGEKSGAERTKRSKDRVRIPNMTRQSFESCRPGTALSTLTSLQCS